MQRARERGGRYEEVGGARHKKHWKGEPASPWAKCDRRQQGVCCLRQNNLPTHLHNQHPPSPPSSLPRASGKEHNTSCLTPFLTHSLISLYLAPTGPQNSEHWRWLNEQGRGLGSRAVMALLVSKAHLHLSQCFPAIQPNQLTWNSPAARYSLLSCVPLVLHYDVILP